MQSRILGLHRESLKKGTFSKVLPRNTLTLFWEKSTLFCQILQGAVSDYRMLISFGLFLEGPQ